MPFVDPQHPLAKLLQRDRRYTLEAYLFVLEALSFAQESLGLGKEPAVEELEPLAGGDPEQVGTVRGGSARLLRARGAEVTTEIQHLPA